VKVDLSERELSYMSRTIFRQRIDKPEDEPEIAAALDPKISVARYRVRQAEDAFGQVLDGKREAHVSRAP
jgi:hypothetical protein